MKKKIELGKKCREGKYQICQKFANMIFQYTSQEEWEQGFMNSEKAKSLMPPFHPECDCEVIDVPEESSQIDINNEKRKQGGAKKRELGGITNVVVFIRTEGDIVYHVKLTPKQEKAVMDFIANMHGGSVDCYSAPVVGIKIYGSGESAMPPIPLDQIDPKKVN